MAPSKWDDEESDSTPPSSPPAPAPIARRSKFEDEEDDSDVLESWDAAEDSEEERKKAAAASAAKAKAEAEAKAKHKSVKQRIAEKQAARLAADDETSSEEDDSEDEATVRARLRAQEKEGDLKHAEDLFGDIGIPAGRGAPKPVTLNDPNDPTKTIELSSLSIFRPNTLSEFTRLRETIVPLVGNNSKKSHYNSFATELCKSLVKDLSSEQVKKIASTLTTLSNEKLRDEKAAEKGTKKTKGAKKTTLNASRDTTLKADTNVYDDGLDDGDFM